MAAYGALVSVMHIIDQLQQHPHPPISLDQKQAESLTENVTFLQDFLESYSHVNSKEVDELESRIADAAYAAEDVIESHIVDQILDGSTSVRAENISSVDLYQGLQKVMEDMDSIKKVAMEIKDKIGVQQHQLHKSSTISAASSTPAYASTGKKKIEVVGFDDVLIEMMDKLIGGEPDRQIIPIVGMGGSGKTTLARNIYEHKVVKKHFDIVAWGTISQEYSTRKILVEILGEEGEDEAEIKLKLYQKLHNRRYLIILDDIWDIGVWNLLNHFFPDNKNGSRIMVTTRQSILAFQVAGSPGIKINLLDENKSWDLFCKIVFGEEECPPNLKEIGKTIVKNCQGLPLSIVVIGGLLAKSERQQEYWEYIAENLNSIVNLEDNEHCLQILYTSYNILPVHLKPCFLYMGVFPEYVPVLVLINLWISEGFLKPIVGKRLEDVGQLYLRELFDRNLIIVQKYTFRGRIKSFKIHDLLKDLCLREAQKHKFLCVNINPKNIYTERRICASKKEYSAQILDSLGSASLARSYLLGPQEPSPSYRFRLLRVYLPGFEDDVYEGESFVEPSFQRVNLRYLFAQFTWESISGFFSSLSLLWNLQTLIVLYPSRSGVILGPPEIWEMPLLRQVLINGIELSDPRDGQDDNIVLKSLHTLKGIANLKYGEEVVKKLTNIKKLMVTYERIDDDDEESPPDDRYCLNNLGHLHKLETLYFETGTPLVYLGRNITFPHSLKKLVLNETELEWEDMTTMVGSLPLLEVLKLEMRSCKGPHWETIEGQFRSLKFLQINRCFDLEDWTTEDSTHFPRLERLVLGYLDQLEEIPSCIGDIPTLQYIELQSCSDSASDSAERILEEQQEFGNDYLVVQVFRL